MFFFAFVKTRTFLEKVIGHIGSAILIFLNLISDSLSASDLKNPIILNFVKIEPYLHILSGFFRICTTVRRDIYENLFDQADNLAAKFCSFFLLG